MNPIKKSYRDPSPSAPPAPPRDIPRASSSYEYSTPNAVLRPGGPRGDEPDFAEEYDRGTGINDPVEDREWAEKTGAR